MWEGLWFHGSFQFDHASPSYHFHAMMSGTSNDDRMAQQQLGVKAFLYVEKRSGGYKLSTAMSVTKSLLTIVRGPHFAEGVFLTPTLMSSHCGCLICACYLFGSA